MMRSLIAAGVALALSGAAALAQEDCGVPGDPCRIAGGDYYVALPEGVERPAVFMFLHGFGANRENRIARENFVRSITDRGYALVMPIGQETPLLPGMDIWGIEDRFDWARDDVAFLEAVLADSIARFGLNGDRILLTGFSRGASMVWKFACERPEAADGFVSISGVFWEPAPTSCAGPIHLVHYHGFADTTMPLEGHVRFEAGERLATIGVLDGIEFWRDVNGCPVKADQVSTGGNLWTKTWLAENCWGGSLIFQLGSGKHAGPAGWVGSMIDWFEQRVP